MCRLGLNVDALNRLVLASAACSNNNSGWAIPESFTRLSCQMYREEGIGAMTHPYIMPDASLHPFVQSIAHYNKVTGTPVFFASSFQSIDSIPFHVIKSFGTVQEGRKKRDGSFVTTNPLSRLPCI